MPLKRYFNLFHILNPKAQECKLLESKFLLSTNTYYHLVLEYLFPCPP